MKKSKTVYVLGAGFSKYFGAPLQNEIINEILLVDPETLPQSVKKLFVKTKINFLNYLKNVLYTSDEKYKEVTLENIYTPIDRCILDNMSLRNMKKIDLIRLRMDIDALIVIMLVNKLRNIENESQLSKFTNFLINKRKNKKSGDPFSIISSNWDIILDNSIYSNLPKNEGVLDYCCHISPYGNGNKIMPSLIAKQKNMFNIKLLKLHGSLNWLQCPRCQRVFVRFFEKIALDAFVKKPGCKFCNKNFNNRETKDSGAELLYQLIMPTYLKDLNNVQLKLIWQNAAVEFSEATELVFIGYSLPESDFELRLLLTRTVRHNANITVILKNKPEENENDTPEMRYRNFFGRRNINVKYIGIEGYINNLSI